MTVYLDLLLIDNFCADAALLYCAVKTVRGAARPARIALAALLGAVLGTGYAVLGLHVALPRALDLPLRWGVAALLPLAAARFKSARSYALCSLAFAGYMAAFAGVLTALFPASPAAGGYALQALPSGVLAGASVLFAALAARGMRALAARRRQAAYTCGCALTHGGHTVRLRAFVDTGNRLTDGRGRGVAVAERAAVLALLADGLFTGRTPCEKIAVQTVNGRSQLTAFRAEKLEIYWGGKVNIVEDVTVAISPRPLAGEYALILPPSFTEEDKLQGVGR